MTKIGALWIKQSSKGDKFLSGQLELNNRKIRVLVFKNKRKNQGKSPDYYIYLGSDRNQADDFQDDIPF